MSLLQEITLDRLWSHYRARFGHPPPIQSADIDQAIALIRRDLAAGGQGNGGDDDDDPRPGGRSAPPPAEFRETRLAA